MLLAESYRCGSSGAFSLFVCCVGGMEKWMLFHGLREGESVVKGGAGNVRYWVSIPAVDWRRVSGLRDYEGYVLWLERV